jgi:hypothetical protein
MAPCYARALVPLRYLGPLLGIYNLVAHDGMRTVIFPRYFHDEC